MLAYLKNSLCSRNECKNIVKNNHAHEAMEIIQLTAKLVTTEMQTQWNVRNVKIPLLVRLDQQSVLTVLKERKQIPIKHSVVS